jgi:hypothetical protein
MPALAALERAVRGLRALDLEPPRDGGAGGSQAFDLYLTTDPALGGAAWSEPRLYARGFDRANAFGIATLERGCRLDSEMARIVAQAALLRLDGGLEDGTLAMQSSYIARLIAPCAPIETAAIDRFQREPERALSEGKRQRFEGSMLFSAYLDEVHGKGQPGGVVNGLVAIAAQSTPAKATHWQNEPDLFDVLRRLLPARELTLGDALVDFAVARAFFGSRSDGQHLSDGERFGDFGRVRFEWVVPYKSLPRRLAPRAPLQPSGSTFVWIDTRGVPGDRGIVAAIRWEASYVYQWSMVRVDAKGRELGRLNAGGVFGRDSAQLTVETLGEASGLLVVGTSLGDDDRKNAFDPDRVLGESSFELTLHPLPGGGGS